MIDFFRASEFIDYLVLKPLSHIRSNWDVFWNDKTSEFVEEEDSYARELNLLIKELGEASPPRRYHDNEDALAEYVIEQLGWEIKKVRGRWIGAEYRSVLEQGGFSDVDEANLILAAAGRIHAAKKNTIKTILMKWKMGI